MHRRFSGLIFALVVTVLATLTHSALGEGTRLSLFNGKNLDGWQVTGSQATVRDGALLLKAGDGFVRTDHTYNDFVLELSWRALKPKQYDSGIYIRSQLPADKRPWPRRYQINLLQGQEGNLIGSRSGKSSGLIKTGEWNRFKLTVIGSTAELEINGQPAWKADGLNERDGYIGLQSEVPGGGQFEFKEIYVTELNHRPLFNGQDLSGWVGAGKDAALCWKVEDGLLMCTGEKGPWLRTAEQYSDFDLRLDYKVKPGGNSGVYVRVPQDGRHHGAGAGVEVQILDDKAERYKKLMPYQYAGSVYAIAPSQQHVGRDAGEWNSMEIECRGASYRVTHNGIVIVDASGDEFAQLKERLHTGFLGFQNHSEAVWFRNVRLQSFQPLF